jgi:hypothetical protein
VWWPYIVDGMLSQPNRVSVTSLIFIAASEIPVLRYYRGMRGAWRPIKRRLIPAAFALAGAALAPAFAGQAAVDLDLSPGLPPAADSGKPAILRPPVATLGQNETGSCLPPLPCGTRLLGTVRKNGAVELQIPALRW